MGWHSSDTRELIFENCFVPTERIVGEIGQGFYQIASAFQTERIVLAGMAVGHAQACLDAALEYAKVREAFNMTIGKFQAIRHKLSQMAIKVRLARLLVYQAATKLDAKAKDALEVVSMAKVYCAQVANEVADDAVQIFGGMGYAEETGIAMHYRDARILRIGGGTDEIMYEVIAKGMGL
jgi:acyl-CoA dehydrogenase